VFNQLINNSVALNSRN